MKKITKAVLPVAGFGTRFLPATKSQPKEMLPIVDKPVIQYIVEEAVASGIEQIIIVTGRGKRSIEDHFDSSLELEHLLEEKGKTELLAEVRKISQMANIAYVRQPQALGDGHAILCAKDLLDNEPFAVLFGDDIIDNEVPALKQLMDVYEQTGSSVVAVTKIDPKDTASYGIIKPKSSNGLIHEIETMVEKPKPENAPSNLGVIGKYICTPEALQSLAKAKPGVGGEIRLIDGFIELLPTQKIFACEMQGKRYDTGHKLGLIEATIAFALKRPDLGPRLKEYLGTLDLK